MTESEYIQSIRDTAQRYIEVIRDPSAHGKDASRRMRHWQAVKEKLSPWTLIALCDLWAGHRTHDAVVKAALHLDAHESEFDGDLGEDLLNRLWDACEKHRAYIAAQDGRGEAPAGEDASGTDNDGGNDFRGCTENVASSSGVAQTTQ